MPVRGLLGLKCRKICRWSPLLWWAGAPRGRLITCAHRCLRVCQSFCHIQGAESLSPLGTWNFWTRASCWPIISSISSRSLLKSQRGASQMRLLRMAMNNGHASGWICSVSAKGVRVFLTRLGEGSAGRNFVCEGAGARLNSSVNRSVCVFLRSCSSPLRATHFEIHECLYLIGLMRRGPLGDGMPAENGREAAEPAQPCSPQNTPVRP